MAAGGFNAPVSRNLTGTLGFDATAVNSRHRLAYNPNQAPNPSPAVDAPAANPIGFDAVLNGEVEDEGLVEIADFGDAPDAPKPGQLVFGKRRLYKTLLATNGPCYDEARLQHFGSLPGPLLDPPNGDEDGESDGQPTANADGDDKNKVDDEDGVVITADDVTITVTATRPGQNTYRVDGWFDRNDNGVFDHPGERLILETFTLDPGLPPAVVAAQWQKIFTAAELGLDNPRKYFSRFRLTLVDGVNVVMGTDITPTGEFVAPDIHGRWKVPPVAIPPVDSCSHVSGAMGTSHGEVEDYPGLPVPVNLFSRLDPANNDLGVGDSRDLIIGLRGQGGEPVAETPVQVDVLFGDIGVSAGSVVTDATGEAVATITANSAATAFGLVRISVPGTPLVGYVFLIVTP